MPGLEYSVKQEVKPGSRGSASATKTKLSGSRDSSASGKTGRLFRVRPSIRTLKLCPILTGSRVPRELVG